MNSYFHPSLSEFSLSPKATRDTLYLDIGERVLSDIISRAKVECGLASIANLLTNKREDRMESFVLSETLKVSFQTDAFNASCL